MSLFAVTFGQRYHREPHPFFGKAHPDGFVVIDAPDMATARSMAVANLGQYWSALDLYDTPEQQAEAASYYPLGELARWTFNPKAVAPVRAGDMEPGG